MKLRDITRLCPPKGAGDNPDLAEMGTGGGSSGHPISARFISGREYAAIHVSDGLQAAAVRRSGLARQFLGESLLWVALGQG